MCWDVVMGCVFMRAEPPYHSSMHPAIASCYVSIFWLSSHQLMPELSEDFPWECQRCNHSNHEDRVTTVLFQPHALKLWHVTAVNVEFFWFMLVPDSKQQFVPFGQCKTAPCKWVKKKYKLKPNYLNLNLEIPMSDNAHHVNSEHYPYQFILCCYVWPWHISIQFTIRSVFFLHT